MLNNIRIILGSKGIGSQEKPNNHKHNFQNTFPQKTSSINVIKHNQNIPLKYIKKHFQAREKLSIVFRKIAFQKSKLKDTKGKRFCENRPSP